MYGVRILDNIAYQLDKWEYIELKELGIKCRDYIEVYRFKRIYSYSGVIMRHYGYLYFLYYIGFLW